MSFLDQNIVITPNVGNANDTPKIVFSGANNTVNAQSISVRAYPVANGTVSFEGSAGQLFSITNQLTGTTFSVNDISGIPSITVQDTGQIQLAPYNGYVNVGTSSANTNLGVAGTIYANNIVGQVVYQSNTGLIQIPSVLSEISNQFDTTTCVFNLLLDQSNVTSIMDSKNLEVVINGARLSPYVKELRYPWITPYDSFKGYRVVSTNTSSKLIIYNAPAYGDQAILTLINSSSSQQTKKYPYSAATIALGD